MAVNITLKSVEARTHLCVTQRMKMLQTSLKLIKYSSKHGVVELARHAHELI